MNEAPGNATYLFKEMAATCANLAGDQAAVGRGDLAPNENGPSAGATEAVLVMCQSGGSGTRALSFKPIISSIGIQSGPICICELPNSASGP